MIYEAEIRYSVKLRCRGVNIKERAQTAVKINAERMLLGTALNFFIFKMPKKLINNKLKSKSVAPDELKEGNLINWPPISDIIRAQER